MGVHALRPLIPFAASAAFFSLELHSAASLLPHLGASPIVWLATVASFQGVLLLAYVSMPRLSQWRAHPAILFIMTLPLVFSALQLRHGTLHDGTLARTLWGVHIPVLLASFSLAAVFPGLLLQRSERASRALFFIASNAGAAAGLLSYAFYLGGFRIGERLGVLLIVTLASLSGYAMSVWPPAATGRESVGPDPAAGASARLSLVFLGAASTFWYLTAHHRAETVLPATPELWALTLLLFLLSYVTAFSLKITPHVAAIGLAFLASLLVSVSEVAPRALGVIPLLLGVLAGCHACHAMVHRHLQRATVSPHAAAVLTATGGTAAGALATLGAPLATSTETQMAVAAAIMLLAVSFGWPGGGKYRRVVLVVLAMGATLGTQGWSNHQRPGTRVLRARGLNGEYEVRHVDGHSPIQDRRVLYHQGTVHGAQYLDSRVESLPVSYYSHFTGMGLSMRAIRTQASPPAGLRIGVIGLGTGATAAYATSGDSVRFFEIDPVVASLVDPQSPRFSFTYVSSSRGSCDVVVGDGRRLLAREEDQGTPPYDILVVDAFSGDSIPTHLLTREAFELYNARVVPDGVIAVHTSSQMLDLRPVVYDAAGHLRMKAIFVRNQPRAPADEEEGPSHASMGSDWIVLSRSQSFWGAFRGLAHPLVASGEVVTQDSAMVVFPRIPQWRDGTAQSWRLLQSWVARHEKLAAGAGTEVVRG